MDKIHDGWINKKEDNGFDYLKLAAMISSLAGIKLTMLNAKTKN